MCRLISALLAIALAGCSLASDVVMRERRQARWRAEHSQVTRVDHGVVLHVVVADPDGIEYVPGKPKLRIIRSHHRGGMLALDKNGARWDGRSINPVQWYCSEDAEPLILHDDSLPNSLLVHGSEGAGKTDAQSKWCYFRALERISQGYTGQIGMSAPVAERLELIKQAIVRNWSPNWYRWNERHSEFRLHTGLSIKLRATKQQSKASGSPWQGYNFSDAGSDEIQDSLDADNDIASRIRDAPGQNGKRFATATAKDDPAFRNWRDQQLKATLPDGRKAWHRADMLVSRSPFTTKHFLELQRATMSLREYQRRFEAKDGGPERQVYHSWDRTQNIRPIPANARDVTARELAGSGRNIAVLAGHDPGKRIDVTMFLKAYELPDARRPDGSRDSRPRWWIIDEITGQLGETHEKHAKLVLEKANALGCNIRDRNNALVDGPRLLVRADPHTRGGDEHPGQDLYAIWIKQGIDIRPAAYVPTTTKPMAIKPESRIELINTLFCDAEGTRRLFVASVGAAPKLIESVETMERDLAGRAEHERKDDRDKSHWPAALAYALWSPEKPRVSIV